MIRHLLWLDGAAGASVGVAMLLLREWLSVRYGLPQVTVDAIAVANVVYGLCALSLASRRVRSEARIRLLVGANAAWSVVCVALVGVHVETATVWGLAHLGAEALFVGGLAALEWRWRDRLRVRASMPVR